MYNDVTPEPLHRCIRSVLRKSSHHNIEIIIVNQTRALENLPRDSRIHFVSSDNLNYASANNLGAAHSKGELIVFLNPRTEVVSPNWLQELAGWCSRPEVGVAGPQLISGDGRIVHGGVVIGLPGYLFQGAQERSRSPLGNSEWYRNCTAVSGTCLATRRSLFLEVGQFDERFSTIADVEFCIRARKLNYRVVLTPHAKLLLHNSGKMVRDENNQFRMYRELVVGEDPYFNSNLSYDSTMLMLKVDI
jgi:GT2 family glycosyltransferase